MVAIAKKMQNLLWEYEPFYVYDIKVGLNSKIFYLEIYIGLA